jgi:diguanylate cyclase (GGDEF)-like protein
LDLDDFKRYNDTYGHLQGDEALKALARLLLAKTRRADVVARFGGEEFVLLLPETTAARARVAAEKIRAAVEQHPFPGRDTQPGGRLTVTLGVATCLGDAEDTLAVVDLADRAMYLGKEQGGNQVNAAPGQRPTPPPAT